MPGLYKELLYCFECKVPVFVIGGFGGAGAKLAGYLTGRLNLQQARLDLPTLRSAAPNLATIEATYERYPHPPDMKTPAEALKLLKGYLKAAKNDLKDGLHNGLSTDDNRRLFETIDSAETAALVMRGLRESVRDNK